MAELILFPSRYNLISAQAICSGINLIQTGQAEVVVAGGVETMSDVPIKFSKPIRERMLASRKIKSTSKMLGLLKGLKMKDLAPEVRAYDRNCLNS